MTATADPSAVSAWTRLPENPVLSPDQADTRDFEHTTLYKSAIIRDEARTLGYTNVKHLSAGISGWKAANAPSVTKPMCAIDE